MRFSITNKFLFIFLTIALVSSALSMAIFYVSHHIVQKQTISLIREISQYANIASEDIAQHKYASLKNKIPLINLDHIKQLSIIDPHQHILFSYSQNNKITLKPTRQELEYFFGILKEYPFDIIQYQKQTLILQGIYENKNLVAMLIVNPKAEVITVTPSEVMEWLILLSLAITFVAFRISNHFLKPILELNTTIKMIAQSKQFGIELKSLSRDEIGQLTNEFNRMSRIISEYDNHQKQLNKNLTNMNEELLLEIETRKKLEVKNNILYNQLILSARNAGMADVATNTLHHVGNILNSIYTSISTIYENTNEFNFQSINKIKCLLDEHQNNLENFLLHDEKGKLILPFLNNISEQYNGLKNKILLEIGHLRKLSEEIFNAISLQLSVSKATMKHEWMLISSMIDDAVSIHKNFCDERGILLSLNKNSDMKIYSDRVKLLQILSEIIRYCIDSVLILSCVKKEIIIDISTDHEDVVLRISDNGKGFTKEQSEHIFSQNFSSSDCNLILLHQIAVSVMELDIKISAFSNGIDQGESFILAIPRSCSEKSQ